MESEDFISETETQQVLWNAASVQALSIKPSKCGNKFQNDFVFYLIQECDDMNIVPVYTCTATYH
jgi:hypothetical protein